MERHGKHYINQVMWRLCVLLLCCVWLFVTPWTVTHQAPLSMGFPGTNTGMVAISFSKRSFWGADWTRNSCTGRQIVCYLATTEAHFDYWIVINTSQCALSIRVFHWYLYEYSRQHVKSAGWKALSRILMYGANRICVVAAVEGSLERAADSGVFATPFQQPHL